MIYIIAILLTYISVVLTIAHKPFKGTLDIIYRDKIFTFGYWKYHSITKNSVGGRLVPIIRISFKTKRDKINEVQEARKRHAERLERQTFWEEEMV